MKNQINCKNCNNNFGEQESKVITFNRTRVNNVEFDFETKKASVKCRNCSQYSTLYYDAGFKNEIDYKKTSINLLK